MLTNFLAAIWFVLLQRGMSLFSILAEFSEFFLHTLNVHFRTPLQFPDSHTICSSLLNFVKLTRQKDSHLPYTCWIYLGDEPSASESLPFSDLSTDDPAGVMSTDGVDMLSPPQTYCTLSVDHQ